MQMAVLGLCALAVASSGCAAAPETVGVRPGFERARVRTVAIVPFYSTSRFSLDEQTHARTLAAYQSASRRWLAARGFEVVRATELGDALREREAYRDFRDGIDLRLPLGRHFEPPPEGKSPTADVATVRELGRAGAIPADTLLVGEVVYQTRTECRGRADDVVPYARIVVREGAPDPPRPCVVSHFRAKLVDVPSGLTMWFGRMMRELHVAESVETDDVMRNIEEVVAATFEGDDGLARFLSVSPES
jgi:hypothetical protein